MRHDARTGSTPLALDTGDATGAPHPDSAEQPAERRAFRAAWAECVAVFGELARNATVPLDDLDPVRFVWRAP